MFAVNVPEYVHLWHSLISNSLVTLIFIIRCYSLVTYIRLCLLFRRSLASCLSHDILFEVILHLFYSDFLRYICILQLCCIHFIPSGFHQMSLYCIIELLVPLMLWSTLALYKASRRFVMYQSVPLKRFF